MVQIIFDIILSLLAVIGIIGLCVEFSRLLCRRGKMGRMETMIYFSEDDSCTTAKTAVLKEILDDRRFVHKIKIPAKSLEEVDCEEICDYIDSGEIELI